MRGSFSLPLAVRFLYTQNPFYLISAGLCLMGLHLSFGNAALAGWGPLLLAGSLAGYAFLLAVTGYVIAKFGRVWDDARSILLVLLFLFMAISTSFDSCCVQNRRLAWVLLGGGLAFAVSISEWLLRGLALKLPWVYRTPYYLLLAVLFAAPLAVSADSESGSAAQWRILCFPLVAAVCLAGLAPAVHQGRKALRGNAAPWAWPMYPWSIFGFLGVAVVLRTYLLCIAFVDAPQMQHAFGCYFLAPLLIAFLFLLLEAGIASKRQWAAHAALIAAPLLLAVCSTGSGSATYDTFLAEVTATLGAPFWLATWALIAFYGYACFRGVRSGELGVAATLLCLPLVDSHTTNLFTLTPVNLDTLAICAGGVFVLAIADRNSIRTLAAGGLLLAAITGQGWLPAEPIWLASAGGALTFGTAFIYSDSFALALRKLLAAASAMLGPLLGLQVLSGRIDPTTTMLALTVGAATGLYLCRREQDSWWLAAGLSLTMGRSCCEGMIVVSALNSWLSTEALIALGAGGVFFAAAATVSAVKAGVWTRLCRWWRDSTREGEHRLIDPNAL